MWRLMIVKNILKLLIVIIFLLIGYYLYFNMPWTLQYKERESSMVTEYYRKGSLQYDIITGNYVFARIKVLFGENVKEIDKKNNTTPLEAALMSMSYPDRFIKMLVKNGANLNKEGHELLSEYIYYFGQQDCNKMIKYLLNKGADPDKNALVVAVTKNNYDLVQILLKNGADVNQKNEKGITAIMAACYSENYEEEPGINTRKQYRIIRLLIEKGADISLKDNKGNTVEKYIQQYRKNIENGNHEYTESLYKLIKSYKIN